MRLSRISELFRLRSTLSAKQKAEADNADRSAVHRSRRAGAGVLTYFAGAGAGVCSPPVKLRQHLFVLQTIIVLQRKNFSLSTNNRYSRLIIRLATNI